MDFTDDGNLNGLTLKSYIKNALGAQFTNNTASVSLGQEWKHESAVMFLIGECPSAPGQAEEPCLIMNKRSPNVRQPGDLCFPGGGVAPFKDLIFAQLLRLPKSPLKKWRRLSEWPESRHRQIRFIRIFLAVALREAWEEIRLNPLKLDFLGVLPLQHLVVFNRIIFPMVGWVGDDCTFKPNWEVQRIVPIPIRTLLNPQHYGRFQPMVIGLGDIEPHPLHEEEFPCFILGEDEERELLWGASFRMVLDFLRIVFGFTIPDVKTLQEVKGYLSPGYPEGLGRNL